MLFLPFHGAQTIITAPLSSMKLESCITLIILWLLPSYCTTTNITVLCTGVRICILSCNLPLGGVPLTKPLIPNG